MKENHFAKKPVKISVIIPVYNGAKTLAECLGSVAVQTYPNYEIIVVDNNSSDRTAAIIKDHVRMYPNVKYVFEQKKGRGSARNAGIRLATGEIFAMTDSDCIAPPEWLAEITAPVIAGEERMVMGFESDPVGNYWTKRRQAADLEHSISKTRDGYIDHLDSKNFAITADLMRGTMFNENIATCEDFDFFLRIRKKTKIRFIPSIQVGHYHDDSIRRLYLTQSSRGFSVEKIMRMHKNDPETRQYADENGLSSSPVGRHLFLIIPWMGHKFINNPSDIPYLIVAELSWRIGVIRAALGAKEGSYL